MRPLRLSFAVLALSFIAPGAQAQDAEEVALIETGHALFDANCALCHQSTGAGRTPMFPALRGNDILADPHVVVSKIAQGLGNMPPFPTLSSEEITAIANYVGTAWSNNYDGPTQDEVEDILAELEPPSEVLTIWDGVYTQAQADRGQQVSRAPCGLCHGSRLNGAPDDNDMVPGPALARHSFLRNWDGRSLGALYTYATSTMPLSNPGSLPPEDYAAIIAYMLAASGAPPGEEELPADSWNLAHILIRPAP